MRCLLFLLMRLCIVTSACAQTGEEIAKAVLQNADGQEVGQATFEEMPDGVKVGLQITRLAPGPHAVHIHAVGKCEPPDFSSAGPHFNPSGKQHGVKNPQGHHAGDLPTVIVGSDGTATGSMTTMEVTLGLGPASLFQPDGTSLVIHANADDNVTDPAGNAGPRIACGVITR